MIFKDVGILGMGLWEGEVVDNARLDLGAPGRRADRDPFRGRRTDDGTVRIAGLELVPGRHDRTLAAVERSFHDAYRGTRRRRYFPAELKVSAADTEAGRRALGDAGVAAADVDVVLAQSLLPDELNPKNEALIAHNLGIGRAAAWCVDTVCASSLTQLSVGAALISGGQARHVLCVQSVAYSRVIDPGSSAMVLIGDMASAFVLGRRRGSSVHMSWRTDGRLHSAISLGWGVPAAAAARRYWEGSKEALLVRFDDTLQAQVMADLSRYAPMVCHEALGRAERTLADVETFITHEPLSWSGAYMADLLGLGDGVPFSVFEEYANISSAYIPAALHDARRAGRIGPGAKVLIFGPAAGYVYGAASLVW